MTERSNEEQIPIYMEPGVTPEKIRALSNRILTLTKEEIPADQMLASLCVLSGMAMAYLRDYAKDLEKNHADLSEKDAASVAEEAEAKRLYIQETSNHPTIHSNRFPSWEELSSGKRQFYRLQARASLRVES